MPKLTLEQLQKIMPNAKARALTYLEPLNKAMDEAGISKTPLRQAAFLAQIAHESGELRYSEEIASGEAYEGRKDLGNTQPGDGKRYKGRGLLQLTGRSGYTRAGLALGLDLVGRPELAAEPNDSARIAAWYWLSHGLNELADKGDFDGITRRINGGTNGAIQRQRYFLAAKAVLGAK